MLLHNMILILSNYEQWSCLSNMKEFKETYPIKKIPLGLVNIYLNKRDMVQLNQYINRHFRKWAKEYHLDNPRDSIIRRYK